MAIKTRHSVDEIEKRLRRLSGSGRTSKKSLRRASFNAASADATSTHEKVTFNAASDDATSTHEEGTLDAASDNTTSTHEETTLHAAPDDTTGASAHEGTRANTTIVFY